MKKWLVLSDIHGKLDFLKKSLASNKDIEYVIIAGDIAPLSSFGIVGLFQQQDWTKFTFAPLLKLYPNKKFILVPGNHDLYLDYNKCSVKDVNHIRKFLHEECKNATLLIDEYLELDGYKIYGVPYVPPINNLWAFECDAKQQQEFYENIPYDLDILISHSPPRYKDIDISLQQNLCNQRPFGSQVLFETIVEKKPRYVFCGHIHSGNHRRCKLRNSIIKNVSVLDENYVETYKPTILKI